MTADDAVPPLEDMVSRAPCGLLITQPDGLIVRVNETFCQWIGYSEQALVGHKHLQDLLTIGGRVFHHTHWGPLLHLHRSLAEVKLDVRHAQGQLVPMLINATRRRYADREFDELAVLVVTERHKYENELLRARQNAEQALDERRRAEQALQQSRDVLGLAMRGAHMGVWSRDLLTNETTWSHELEELIGLHSDDGCSATDAASFSSDGDGTAEGNGRANGNGNGNHNDDGKDSGNSGGDKDHAASSPRASLSSRPAVSERILLSRIHDDDRAVFTDAIEHSRVTRTDYLVEFRMLHADGNWRWMEGRGRALYDRQGNALAMHGLVIDITPRKSAEALLKDLNRQLSEADHRKDEFLATLAHELRNPLAPMGNILQLLHQKTFDDPQLLWARDVLERQLRHITHLVDDLLEVSRITQGKLELRKQQVSLGDVMTNALEACSPLITMSMHTLTVTMPAPDVRLYADPIRLSQMIQNLLNNAAKYTPPGGHIVLSADAGVGTGATQQTEVSISVRDTGIGIPDEHLSGIFQMFSQLAPALDRSQGGLGIGLSLVKALAELHGGSVQAESDGANCGSTFTLRLPSLLPATLDATTGRQGGRAVSDPAAAAATLTDPETSIRPASEPAPERNQHVVAPPDARGVPGHALGTDCTACTASETARRVLIVDDNEDAASSLAMVLEMAEHQVETAFNGTSGLLLAESFKPDVVILDIGLPDINGYEVARQMRRSPGGQDVLLLALTGWGQQQDKRDAVNAGFDHHFTKPVDFDGLLALLSPVPDRRRITAQKAVY